MARTVLDEAFRWVQASKPTARRDRRPVNLRRDAPDMLDTCRVNSRAVTDWVETWGPLVTLASTVVLAGITAWLAHLTKVMADGARTAAEQSRIAAEASLSSVAAAEASVDVRFDVAPVMGSTVGELERAVRGLEASGMSRDDEFTPEMMAKITAWRSVHLTCRGATVSVHGLKVTYIGVQEDTGDDTNLQMISGRSYDMVLAPSDDLPRPCHSGETIEFEVPDRPLDEQIVEIATTVLYAFGNGPIREREAKWTKPPQAQSQRAS